MDAKAITTYMKDHEIKHACIRDGTGLTTHSIRCALTSDSHNKEELI